MSLHAPSPTPSPGPANGRSPNFRASMGPTSRPANIATQGMPPASPRPGGVSGAGRPTSELLSGTGMFQTPEGVFYTVLLQRVSLSRLLQPKPLISGLRTCRIMRQLWCVLNVFVQFDAFLHPLQEDMAKASLDANFKEELSAIEQCKSCKLRPLV